ncbi:FUN14 domain-containing protein 1 [Gamsiella multidivaricata]|nr:FUN14 domain-containing protein 1 [Gamsiella multidivaricata]
MFAPTLHLLRPAAVLRSAVRNVSIAAGPARINPTASPSAFVRNGHRFASTASTSKLHQASVRSSVHQSLAISSAFRNASSTSSRTIIAAGAATTCVFGPLILSRSAVGSAGLFSSRHIAHCAPATPDAAQDEPLINSKELTFGTAMGLCSGYLVKKLGKLMMLVVGLGFVSLQLLANSGYVKVNWVLVESKFMDRFDVDKDGKVTMNDAKHGFRWLIGLLTNNFQFKSTFVGGFVLGFRYG